MHLFFASDITTPSYTLAKDESKHAITVLRLKVNDTIKLTEGSGTIYTARITDPNPKACKVEVIDTYTAPKRNYELEIAVAPTKNMDRYEWFAEKATEIGIDTISPILCEHSERKVLKLERVERIIQSAVKQSEQAYVPRLNNLIAFEEYVKSVDAELKFIAHCNKTEKTLLKDAAKANKNICVLIGPEGDFSPVEINIAFKNGFIPISLGENRLRTETAALVACHTISLINQ